MGDMGEYGNMGEKSKPYHTFGAYALFFVHLPPGLK